MTDDNDQMDETTEENENDWFKNSFDMGRSGNEGWGWGLGLILVGGVFLLNNLGITSFSFHNWWAIFILVPGLNMVTNAWQSRLRHGHFTGRARRAGFWGTAMIALALIFFFDLQFDLFFAIFMIATGIFLLFGRRN